jgi:asparagine synthase (glutamine-hydrolysing)
MSGIGGIVYFDGQKSTRHLLVKMADAMKHRGPHGRIYLNKANIGFVYLSLYNTPESKVTHLPDERKKDNLAIVFQGRLDNREEIYNATHLPLPLRKSTDSDLLLSAYLKWGTNCCCRLLGDFSFAIWDNTRRSLYCGRDHMGVMPFYYYHDNNLFAFASEIKGLLCLPQIRSEINKNRIADYLTCLITDSKSTFYSNIFRLPSGHDLTVSGNSPIKIKSTHYGKLTPTEHNYKNGFEFQEHFRELFTDAVRCRLRAINPVGAYLSGGLDSSTIVCTISSLLQKELSLPLHTFSSVFNKTPECDERKFFSSVIERYPLVHHSEPLDDKHPGPVFDSMVTREDEPFFAPFFISPWYLLKKAQQCKIRTLFDGHDGDSAISYGSGFLNELLYSGRLIRLIRECRAIGNSNTIQSTLRTLRRVTAGCCFSKLQFAGLHSPAQKAITTNIQLLSRSFAEETCVKERLLHESRRIGEQGLNERIIQQNAITHPRQQLTLELFERQAAYFQINQVYPYFDKRIIEFCLGLPAEQKLSGGFNRRIVRESFKNILPETIRLRKEKTYFNSSLNRGILKTDRDWFYFNLDTMDEAIYNYINLQKFKKIYEKLKNNPGKNATLNELGFMLRCLSFSKWLSLHF